MTTVLVTGASGFIGSHLVPELARRGYTVVGTYFHQDEKRHAAADWRMWTLSDGAALERILAEVRPSSIIHLASPSHVPTSSRDPEGTIDAILKANVRFCAAVAAASFVERLVYVSSAEVYGRPRDESALVTEDHPTRPRSMYGICKLAAALWFQEALSERAIVLRPFNQIGPGQSPRFAISSFAHQIADMKLNRQPPTLVTGNIDVVRDWTDVRESVVAHVLALEKGRPGETYNICSGRGIALRALVEAMARAAGIPLELQVDPTRLRPGEPLRFVGDGDKLRRTTGWHATGDATVAAVEAVQAAIAEG